MVIRQALCARTFHHPGGRENMGRVNCWWCAQGNTLRLFVLLTWDVGAARLGKLLEAVWKLLYNTNVFNWGKQLLRVV